MIITKLDFGYELKKMIEKKQSVKKIGEWCNQVYIDWPENDDVLFLDLLDHLSTMELGPEFAFSYEELEQIADDLIAGKEVNL